MNKLLHDGTVTDQCEPVCLVLSPTRELAVQTNEEAKKFIYRTALKTEVVYGGVSGRPGPCEILVATPGRLIDLVKKDKGKQN